MLFRTRFAEDVANLDVEWVVREENEELFNNLGHKYNARAIPFIIDDEKNIAFAINPSPREVEAFLKNY